MSDSKLKYLQALAKEYGDGAEGETLLWAHGEIERLRSELAEKRTPAARWRENGEADPHLGQFDCERAALPMGELTDDEMANAVFLHPGIGNLQAAKDRIRWLSRSLSTAIARVEALEGAAEKQIRQLARAGVERLNEVAPGHGWDDGSKTAELYIRDMKRDAALAREGVINSEKALQINSCTAARKGGDNG